MKRWLWCVWFVALVAACKKKEGGGNREAEYDRQMYKAMHDALVAPERRGPGFATVPEPLPPARPATAGPAYILVGDVGLVTFGVDGKVTQQKLPLGHRGRVAVAPDGAAIVGATKIMKVDHGTVSTLGGDDSPSTDAMGAPLEVAPDGKIWVVNGSTVYGWDGAKWTKYETPQAVHDLAFDGKGRVFTAGAQQLGVIDGGAWKKLYDLDGTPHEGVVANPRFFNIDVVGKQLVALHTFGILKLDGANAETTDRKVTDPLLLDAQLIGNEYVTSTGNQLLHASLAGGPDKLVPLKETVGSGVRFFDARGRAWLASGSTLSVVEPTGEVTSWPTATIPEITGSIDAISVVGNGPDKLPAKGAVAKGTIRGHVTKKGTAIAKAYVEVCQNPLDHIPKDETPCGYTLHGKGETDDHGVFSVTGLPLQNYTIVIRDHDQWYSLLGTTCAGMHDGDTCDAGELDITNKVFPTP